MYRAKAFELRLHHVNPLKPLHCKIDIREGGREGVGQGCTTGGRVAMEFNRELQFVLTAILFSFMLL